MRSLTAWPRWGKLSGYHPEEDFMVEENSGPDVSGDADYSEFLRISGLRIEEIGGEEVRGWIDLDEQHHTPWGVVHGGVYAAAVESAASLGASAAVKDREQFAVGVNNNTDFLRPVTKGRVDVVAEPIMQGKGQQLWQVVITRAEDGKEVARGQVRLQNVPAR
jgi:1,4-dihydroxy-2-naphthoyl-CoA hydrolase